MNHLQRNFESETKFPQVPPPLAPSNELFSSSIPLGVHPIQKLKQLKWPPAYDHKDPTEWPTTYGILKHIYQSDVIERKLVHPTDFFMDLYNVAIVGTAKLKVSGPFQSMMDNGQISDALGF